jgi:hypothetical protein
LPYDSLCPWQRWNMRDLREQGTWSVYSIKYEDTYILTYVSKNIVV